MTTWTQMDWYTWPREQYIVSHSTTWTPWIDPIYGETHDQMDNMYWYNIWRATRPCGNILWATRPHRQYDEPLWPHGHGELIQYIVIHPTTWAIYGEPRWPHGLYMVMRLITWAIYGEPRDHMDTMNWYNIWWYTRPREQYMVSHATTWALCIGTTYDKPQWPHEQYMVRHSTTWTVW